MKDPRCPDVSICRNCGEPIVWDDYSYLHVESAWADCGVKIISTGVLLGSLFDVFKPLINDYNRLRIAKFRGPVRLTVAEPIEWDDYG